MTQLTEQHHEIQALARDFAKNEIAPHSAEWNAEHHVPVATLLKMADLGFLGLIVPEEYGGTGLDQVARHRLDRLRVGDLRARVEHDELPGRALEDVTEGEKREVGIARADL